MELTKGKIKLFKEEKKEKKVVATTTTTTPSTTMTITPPQPRPAAMPRVTYPLYENDGERERFFNGLRKKSGYMRYLMYKDRR